MSNLYYTVDEVLSEVLAITSEIDESSIEAKFIRNWIWRALRYIGPRELDVKDITIKAEDLSIKKPKDMVSAIDIALFQADDREVYYRFQGFGERIHNDYRIGSHKLDVSEDRDFYHLGSNGDSVVCARLKYYALPLDQESGEPLIHEDHIEAIKAYVKYQMAMRRNDNRSEIEQYRSIWELERVRAKSKGKMPDMLRGKEIAKQWMTLIQKVNFDNF